MSRFNQGIVRALILLLMLIARPALSDDAPDHTLIYAPFQALLDRHLTEHRLPAGGLLSWFDYAAAITADDTRRLLQEQDARLAAFDPSTLRTRESALAFWINAYNYFMIQHLLTHPQDNGPVGSVRDYGRLFSPYRVFGLKRFNVGGINHSLRQIELDILLGDDFAERGWKDARIHFAVNCASVGCPPLRRAVYQAGTLDQILSENSRLALDTPIHLTRENLTLRLSQLFEWYAEDFMEHSGSVRDFIDAYGSDSVREAAAGTDRLGYIDYDWRINSAENFSDWVQ